MAKSCGRCRKTVYPAEEMKCLDQVWHKSCFKCTECGMTLNLKNYIGFSKMPYCNAHNPSKKLTATVVAETPESRRVSEITKMNSGHEYRKEFEKSKGTAISVCDDPSMQMARQASHNASGFNYSGGTEAKIRQQSTSVQEYDDEAPAPTYQPPVQLPYASPGQGPPPSRAPPAQAKPMFRAVYDYEAQDSEEVSFNEGDIIEDFSIIDEGWGTGTVQSTGQRGMIPSNYVESC